MLIKTFYISSILTLLSFDLKKCCHCVIEKRITVIGTAIVLKNDAAVRTDNNLLYYLDGINDWDKEYLGKKVMVTGKLIVKKYHFHKSSNPEITAIPQQRLGTWNIIKKAKWSLVE